jgi:predicted metal-dependent hydrolase
MLRALFTRTPPPAVSEIEITFAGVRYRIGIKRNRQARRYTLRIDAGTRGVVLTMPARGSLKEAKAFAERNGAWVATRLERLPEAAPFVDGAIVPLRGVPHRIAHRGGRRGTVWTENVGAEVLLCVAGDAPHMARRVTDYLKRQARQDLDAASRRHAAALSIKVMRVSVRDTTSRWGSCSTTGRLSYSWRLVLAPPFVLDYLAAHEVAHLVEMNHSPRFWRVVRGICPDMDRAKVWIDAHGTDLHRYGLS